ncbi:MAG TPA: MarR family transcriptional regulator [Acidimicrobiia bacterium]
MAPAPKSKQRQALAEHVWRQIYGFFWMHREEHLAVLQELGLTPGHMKALFVLDLDEPYSMGTLAGALSCDASTMTWLVDSLEERGIVERQTTAKDRRVKTVVLTPLGAKTKAELLERLYQPPQALLDLESEQLEALDRALSVLPSEGP